MKCTACNKRFKLRKEKKYIVEYPRESLLDRREIWETFDCPHCGCQNLANLRYQKKEDEKPEPPTIQSGKLQDLTVSVELDAEKKVDMVAERLSRQSPLDAYDKEVER